MLSVVGLNVLSVRWY